MPQTSVDPFARVRSCSHKFCSINTLFFLGSYHALPVFIKGTAVGDEWLEHNGTIAGWNVPVKIPKPLQMKPVPTPTIGHPIFHWANRW